MAIEFINTGTSANAGDGDSLRSAFEKVNRNFQYIDGVVGGTLTIPNGYTGSEGLIGPQGVKGDTGFRGYYGSRGAGYTGSASYVPGYTGSAGLQGIQGEIGLTGEPGPQGDPGEQGPIGFFGSRGDIGPRGYYGSHGPQGVIGYRGSTGYYGSQGEPGTPGVNGYGGVDVELSSTPLNTNFNFSVYPSTTPIPLYSGQTIRLRAEILRYDTTPLAIGVIREDGEAGLALIFDQSNILGIFACYPGSEGPLTGDIFPISQQWNYTTSMIGTNRYLTVEFQFTPDTVNGNVLFGQLLGIGNVELQQEYITDLADNSIGWHLFAYSAGSFNDISQAVYEIGVGLGGATGYTGSSGAAVYRGYDGSASTVPGYTGSLGDIGEIGYVGSQGDIGPQGPQGTVGFFGSIGSRGYWGSLGYWGSAGYIGSPGIQGPQGIPGEYAALGYTGSSGEIGAPGDVGPQGELGYVGSQGDIGNIGPQGPQGYTGSRSVIPGYAGSGGVGYTGSQGAGYYGSTGYTGSASTAAGYAGSIGYFGSKGDVLLFAGDTPPSPTTTSTLWYDTISGRTYVYYDNAWVDSNPASDYVLPAATTSTLGGVKVDGTSITIDVSGVISGSAAVDWLAVPSSIVPTDDLTYDLGAIDKQWRSLYVGTATIYIGGVPLTLNTETSTLVIGTSTNNTSTTALASEQFVIDYISTATVAGSSDRLTTGSYSLVLGPNGMLTLPGTVIGDGIFLNGDLTEAYAHIQLPNNANANTTPLLISNDNGNVQIATINQIGLTTYYWTFDNSGKLTLPDGGTINSNTASILAAFASTSSIVSTVDIKPAGGTENQLLRVYPTISENAHLHITTPDLNNSWILLGDDQNYVEVANGHVAIGTSGGAYLQDGSGWQWYFDSAGKLVFPSHSFYSSVGTSSTDLELFVNGYTTKFGSNGTTTFVGTLHNDSDFEISSGPDTGYTVEFIGYIDDTSGSPGATLHVTEVINGTITDGMTIYGAGLGAPGWTLQYGTVIQPQGSGGTGNYYLPGANFLIASQSFNNGVSLTSKNWNFTSIGTLNLPDFGSVPGPSDGSVGDICRNGDVLYFKTSTGWATINLTI